MIALGRVSSGIGVKGLQRIFGLIVKRFERLQVLNGLDLLQLLRLQILLLLLLVLDLIMQAKNLHIQLINLITVDLTPLLKWMDLGCCSFGDLSQVNVIVSFQDVVDLLLLVAILHQEHQWHQLLQVLDILPQLLDFRFLLFHVDQDLLHLGLAVYMIVLDAVEEVVDRKERDSSL